MEKVFQIKVDLRLYHCRLTLLGGLITLGYVLSCPL